jgi:ribosome-binding ATPase YchF (GTP1/OBG family)
MGPLLDRLKETLSEGLPARSLELTDDEREMLYDLHLITLKKQIYICNVDEDGLGEENPLVKAVKEKAEEENAQVVVLCGKLEADIAALDDPEEREIFLEEAGLKESGLSNSSERYTIHLACGLFLQRGARKIKPGHLRPE